MQREQIYFESRGAEFEEAGIQTPIGGLSARKQSEMTTGSSCYINRLFQEPEDYRTLKNLFAGQQFLPAYERYLHTEEQCGDDVFILPEIIGLDRFVQYYLPHYDKFVEFIHRAGKMTGIHLNGHSWLFEEDIGASQIDCIESFTPPSDGDLSLAQARVSWHAKVLWVNFPPSIHNSSVEEIAITTHNILRQAGDGEGILVSITDTIPANRHVYNLNAILQSINAQGQLPLNVLHKKRESAQHRRAHHDATRTFYHSSRAPRTIGSGTAF